MKTVLRILTNDIKAITSSAFALIIVIGIIVLPSLYAWVNIYASQDPYVNTGNLPVAVASRDPGVHLTDGSYMNAAGDVEKELKKDDKIGWQFPGSADEAVEGVRSGKYYAAIIFEDTFTYDMIHLKEALASEKPAITYYTNTKKNGVASKITDAAASSLLEKINTRYLDAIFDHVFEDAGDLSKKLDGDEAVEEALKQLTDTRDALADLNTAIGLLSSGSDDIKGSLNKAERDLGKSRSRGRANYEKARESIDEAKNTVRALEEQFEERVSTLNTTIAEMESEIYALENSTDEKEIALSIDKVKTKLESIQSILKFMRGLIPADSRSSGAQILRDTIDMMILQGEGITEMLREDPGSIDRKALADEADALANFISVDLTPGVGNLISDFERAIRIADPLLSATNGMLDDIDPVIGSAGGTLESMDTTFGRLQTVLTGLEKRVDEIITQVRSADVEDRMGMLTEMMGGDPEEYSDFFSSLVGTRNHQIYSVKNYGTAMTPFYTTLAIWVGGVLLVSLLHTVVNRRKFPQITESQGFFGRYIIFFIIGQLQTAIVVAGDIFIFHCEPVHPWLFWLSAAFTSMIFILLIYSIVLSFGIIGKTAVVVVMVLQIAGSSGSFPIEILPEIFAKIYKFFPFPYAINGMREAICGLYGHDILIYMGQLMVFGVVGLLIGLLVRRPFIGVNHYVTERLEETEVL